ncbi:hypothetical protein BDR04DRAFT_1031017, partial [Suillus decipiens]
LHPLPVPEAHRDSITIDFICPLPKDKGYNTIVTIMDCLNADIHILPCRDTVPVKLAIGLYDPIII